MAESISRDGDTGRAVVTATGTLVDDIAGAATPETNGVERFGEIDTLDDDVQRRVDREFFGEVPVTPAADPDGSLAEALRSARGHCARLRYELDLAESIEAGLEDAVAGRVMPHDEVMAKLRARFPG